MGKRMKQQEKVVEKEVRKILVDEATLESIEKEVPKMKVITPSEVSDKYGVRVSVAKSILKRLEEKGLIKLVSSDRRLKVWTGARAEAAAG
ncbi:MAG: eS25 family ribosomal protein [Candidatus Jordarchaeales archaeon]|nr:40S ribosomal protein S25 [Candidatus Jordarchaeia archaeon]